MERRLVEQRILRWLNEAIRDGNVAIFDQLLLPDVCDRSAEQPAYGSASFKTRAQAVHDAFSDIETALDELLVDGAQIAWRWRVIGTHTGAFAGFAATGRRVTLRGVNFQRLEAGRVAEHWTLADLFGLAQTLR